MDLDRAEANLSVAVPPTVPMSGIWRTIRSYILWSHERGTIHYDIMVTLILIFVLLSPQVINFNDKPVEHNPQRTGVMVSADGNGGLIYQVEGSAVNAKDDAAVRGELLQIIEPISGEVKITKIEQARDGKGEILRYKVWVEKE
jgi:hypothetical protein